MEKRQRINLSLKQSDLELLEFFADRRGMPKSSYAIYLLRQALDAEYADYKMRKDFPDDFLCI